MRTFILFTWLVAASLLSVQAQSTVLYSTYGPGNSFCNSDDCGCWNTGFHPTEPHYHRGMPFTVGSTEPVRFDSATITISVFRLQEDQGPPSGNFILSLNEDAGGLPGTVLETLSVDLQNLHYNVPATLVVRSISRPTLSPGARYWLTTEVSDPATMSVCWLFNDQGVTGPAAWHSGDHPWIISHPDGTLAAFSVSGSSAQSTPSLYLNNQRFQLQVNWGTPGGGSGVGQPVQLTEDSGYFWFFGAANIELVVKIIDGRGGNGHFWFFYAALTDLKYTITVTDTQTGDVKVYEGVPGVQSSGRDLTAFQ